jgi:protein gp37
MRKTVRPTKIDWSQFAWNPIVGCRNGCPFCYARSYCKRFGNALGCPDCAVFEPHIHESEFPATWPTTPAVVFVGPRTDLWSAGVPQEWRNRVYIEVMHARDAGNVDCVILTKRPQEMTDWDRQYIALLKNLWVGVSVTGPLDMGRYKLLCDAVPAGRRVLSMEPFLCSAWHDGEEGTPDWAIIGPRTPVAKPLSMLADRARQCVEFWQMNAIPVFVKGAAQKAWPGVPLVQEWPAEMHYKGSVDDG